jgi:hypothetical protein
MNNVTNITKFWISSRLFVQIATNLLLVLLFFYFLASLAGKVHCFTVEGNFISLFLSSSVLPSKPRRLNKQEQEAFSLSDEEEQIIVGLLLGDLNIRKLGTGHNPHMRFDQSTIHEEYLWHLYERFSVFCLTAPKTIVRLPDKKTGKIYSSIRFSTRALPCFNKLYNLFYPNGLKLVPAIVADLLTPLSLAYWIADDGNFSKTGRNVTLSTYSFLEQDVKLLARILTDKFNLKTSIYKHKDGFIISISVKSLPTLQNLLVDAMPPMMKYKIGL